MTTDHAVYNPNSETLGDQQVDHMTTNKPGTAGYNGDWQTHLSSINLFHGADIKIIIIIETVRQFAVPEGLA